MSLKAKLEAVIYAAEEPVTLTQLAILFSDEALQWKADQDAQENGQASVSAPPATMPLLNDEFSYLEPDSAPSAGDRDPGAQPVGAPEPLAAPETNSAPPAPPELEPEAAAAQGLTADTASPETAPEEIAPADATSDQQTAATSEPAPDPESVAAEGLTADPVPQADTDLPGTVTEKPAHPEADAKRLARLRDREVKAVLRLLLDELIDDYIADERGIEIREIAGGYRMATKPECHDAVRAFVKSLKPPLKLSLPALETLAVIAYKQPITAPEVNEIRGVDSSGVFGSLLARKLIATAGRKQVIGRPILYKTTREFLLRFGLKDVTELPSMEEFEKMAASELDEPETAAATGEDASGSAAAPSGPEFDENASEEDPASDTAQAPPEAPAAESQAAAPEAVTEMPAETQPDETAIVTGASDPVPEPPAEPQVAAPAGPEPPAAIESIPTPTETDATAAEAEAESTPA